MGCGDEGGARGVCRRRRSLAVGHKHHHPGIEEEKRLQGQVAKRLQVCVKPVQAMQRMRAVRVDRARSTAKLGHGQSV